MILRLITAKVIWVGTLLSSLTRETEKERDRSHCHVLVDMLK